MKCRSPRWRSAPIALALTLALTSAVEPPAAHADDFMGPGERLWTAWVQGGGHFLPVYDSPFGRQLIDAGSDLIEFGPNLGLGVSRHVLDWLIVGGYVDVRWNHGRQLGAGLVGSRGRDPGLGAGRAGAMLFVQPSLCIDYSCRSGGGVLGLQVGLGGGPSWWTLHGRSELAAHARMEAAMVWDLYFQDWFFGLRLANGLTWQSGMGRYNLTQGPMWTAGVELRVGARW